MNGQKNKFLGSFIRNLLENPVKPYLNTTLIIFGICLRIQVLVLNLRTVNEKERIKKKNGGNKKKPRFSCIISSVSSL